MREERGRWEKALVSPQESEEKFEEGEAELEE
jgi:hypothetical protein